MLNWLDQFFTATKILVGQQVSDVTHWALHAISSVFLSVFRLVGQAWDKFTDAVTNFGKTIGHFAHEVYSWAAYIVKVVIPRILRWAEAELAKLAARISQVYKELLSWVAKILARIEQEIKDVTRWVLVNIWDPLKKYADTIYQDLRKWGYTAWWYITHPADLAELLYAHIVTSLEKHAWEIAPRLGQFLTALIVHNLKRIVTLIEDIVMAVF